MKVITKILIFALLGSTTFTSIAQNKIKLGIEMDSSHSMLLGTPIDSLGTKLFWNPSKSIFLAGTGNGFDQAKWDIDSIGPFASSFGIINEPYGNGAMIWGLGNTISRGADWSTAFGEHNVITQEGLNSTAWGKANIIRAANGTAWGTSNTINADFGTVWGNANSIFADYSTVWGQVNVSLNSYNTIGGYGNRTRGKYSTALGLGLLTHGAANTTVGAFNDTTLIVLHHNDSITSNTPLFVVGNGTAIDNRSNALSVFASGLTKIGDGVAEADLHINQSQIHPDGGTGGIILQALLTKWQIYTTGNDLNFAQNGAKKAFINQNGEFISMANFNPAGLKKLKSNQSAKIISQISIGRSENTKSKVSDLEIGAYKLLQDFPEMITYCEITGEPIGVNYRQLYLTAVVALQHEMEINKRQEVQLQEQHIAIMELKAALVK